MNKILIQAALFAFAVATAAVYDLKKWFQSTDENGNLKPFDWKKAVPRWILGALIGSGGAAGVGELL